MRDLAVGDHVPAAVGHDPVHGDGNPPVAAVREPPRLDAGIDLRKLAAPVRRRPESNRCKRLCRPLRNHSATSPGAAKRSERVTASDPTRQDRSVRKHR